MPAPSPGATAAASMMCTAMYSREFTGYGLLERTPTHLRLTPRGRLLSNELFQRLLPEPVA